MPMQAQSANQRTAKPLSQLEVGQAGWIVAVETNNIEGRRELTSLGISPQAIVRMFANHRSHFIFKVDGKKIAADQQITAGILVQPLS